MLAYSGSKVCMKPSRKKGLDVTDLCAIEKCERENSRKPRKRSINETNFSIVYN